MQPTEAFGFHFGLTQKDGGGDGRLLRTDDLVLTRAFVQTLTLTLTLALGLVRAFVQALIQVLVVDIQSIRDRLAS